MPHVDKTVTFDQTICSDAIYSRVTAVC